MPEIPHTPQQEGARWRHHRPSGEAVADWFKTVPLDDDMEHERYVGGVVIIPQTEKVKYATERGTTERHELTFTPYMQIGTRVAYARRLAESRNLIYHPAPLPVPRSRTIDSPYFNANMPEGLWWHVIQGEDGGFVRYLCATWAVRLFDPPSYARHLRGDEAMPVIQGIGTKQVSGGDSNALMKAETGAVGRALGVAGILVVGTGIASAEDMQEFTAQPQAAPELPQTEIAPGAQPPEASNSAERLAQLRSEAMAVQTKMQEETPEAWAQFAAWWEERRSAEGWRTLGDVPLEALSGIVERMQGMHGEALASRDDNAAGDSANGQTEVVA